MQLKFTGSVLNNHVSSSTKNVRLVTVLAESSFDYTFGCFKLFSKNDHTKIIFVGLHLHLQKVYLMTI